MSKENVLTGGSEDIIVASCLGVFNILLNSKENEWSKRAMARQMVVYLVVAVNHQKTALLPDPDL